MTYYTNGSAKMSREKMIEIIQKDRENRSHSVTRVYFSCIGKSKSTPEIVNETEISGARVRNAVYRLVELGLMFKDADIYCEMTNRQMPKYISNTHMMES
mgnify:CR=1 FL=1